MSISTTYESKTVSGSQIDGMYRHIDRHKIEVILSNAEARVIASKAKKAGLSINEYMRYAALGFPMS